MENQGFSLLKNLISEQLYNSAEDRARIKRSIQRKRLLTYLVLAIVCGVATTFFLVDVNGLVANKALFGGVFVAVFTFSTFYFDKKKGGLAAKNSQLWRDYYQKNKNAYVYLREYFFPMLQIEPNLDTKKRALLANPFLLADYPKHLSYLGQVNEIKTQLTHIEKNCFLIAIYLDKTLQIKELHLQTKKIPIKAKISTPPAQTFNYFPEIENHFNFYTEEKVETAQFLQVNEDIFLQLTKFTKFNFAIILKKNQIFCMLEDIYSFLFLDVAEDVNPTNEEIDEYINQLQELSKFINLLQRLG